MPTLTPRQSLVLIALTLSWGINWPIMKIGVTGFPPLTFRSLSLAIGSPLLGLGLLALRIPLRVPRAHWGSVLMLSATNMFIWQALMILAVQSLSSGRAAILGYSMPIFSAVFGALFFGQTLRARAWSGVAAAAVGVLLLLWYEFGRLAGQPLAVLLALTGAATWAVGTQQMRRHQIPVPTATIVFWMTAVSLVVLTLLALTFEHDRWVAPTLPVWGAVVYNGLVIFALAQLAWFHLARTLPPVASSLSVMMIPILGVFSGAWWLGEALHWQDWTAMALMVLAIASVLWPERRANPP